MKNPISPADDIFSVVPLPEAEEDTQEDLDYSTLLPAARVNRWDPRLVLDLALNVDLLPAILERYGMSGEEFEALSAVPAFRRELARTIRDIRENGVSFLGKAKFQAETYLEVIDAMINNDHTPPGIRLAAIQSMVEWAGLKPKEPKQNEGSNAAVINVQINF